MFDDVLGFLVKYYWFKCLVKNDLICLGDLVFVECKCVNFLLFWNIKIFGIFIILFLVVIFFNLLWLIIYYW